MDRNIFRLLSVLRTDSEFRWHAENSQGITIPAGFFVINNTLRFCLTKVSNPVQLYAKITNAIRESVLNFALTSA